LLKEIRAIKKKPGIMNWDNREDALRASQQLKPPITVLRM
jgi:hypothetical protein